MKKSAQDDVNIGGYYFKNMIRYWKATIKIILNRHEWSEITVDDLFDRINSNRPPLIIDLRTAQEFADGHIPNARSISITQLASNLEFFQSFKEKLIITCCPGGGMSLIAVDIMVKAGFNDVKSLKGGTDLWSQKGYPTTSAEDIKPSTFEDKAKINEGKPHLDEKSMSKVHYTLDARNLSCPLPILKSKKALKTLKVNQVLEILTTDPGSFRDIPAWALVTGQELLVSEERGPRDFRFLVKRMK